MLFLLQENDETYDHIKESSDLANAEAIKTCPVVLEEDYNYEQGALYQQVGPAEFLVEILHFLISRLLSSRLRASPLPP